MDGGPVGRQRAGAGGSKHGISAADDGRRAKGLIRPSRYVIRPDGDTIGLFFAIRQAMLTKPFLFFDNRRNKLTQPLA